jgi:parallel beta-helix repeat protein
MFLLLLASLPLLAFRIQSVEGDPRTWTVDDDGLADFDMIQEAINNANEGDIIFVRNGTYFENIVVSKSLVILGENAMSTILDSHDQRSFNVIISANVTLSRFTLQNGHSGVCVNHPSNVDIQNNIIRNQSYDGVFIQTWHRECYVTVQNNLISTSYRGIECSYSEGFCAIEGNTLSQVGSGIMIGYGIMNGKVVNNTVLGNGSGTGMDLNHFYDGTIEGNYIAGFDDGARFEDTSSNRIFKNVLAANSGFGLGLLSCDNNTLFKNDILNNSFGIWLSSSSGNNVICHNNFKSNSQQAHIEPPIYPNIWDNSYPSGGNYWSDYSGTDTYGGICQNETGSDGIGDIPYIISANNTDRYPLMKPYATLIGDVNGDEEVNMRDAMVAIQAFNSFPGQPRWNRDSDLDSSGRVDMRDLIIVVLNFNKHE